MLPSILFVTIGLAALEGVSGIISTSAAYIQTSINLKTAQKQIEINKLAETSQPRDTVHAIGFATDTYIEEDDYDE